MTTELDIAEAIRDGTLPSPQRVGDMFLYNMRLTGTGFAFRPARDEHVFRPVENFLTPEFVGRCAGLPITLGHPESGVLDTEEFANRAIGSVMFAFVQGDEVRCIARIYDAPAAEAMASGELSTSPSVVFTALDGNVNMPLDDGSTLLVEGTPSALSHCAIVPRGVWDKGGPPTGIQTDAFEKGYSAMSEDNKVEEPGDQDRKDADRSDDRNGELLNKLLTCLDGLHKRMDAWDAANAKTDGAVAPPEMASEPSPEMALDVFKRRAADAAEARRMDAALTAAQVKADAAFQAWGKQAPPPIASETALRYRVRTANMLKHHSKLYGGVDLSAVAAADSAAFDAVELQIMADAVEASKNPGGLPGGEFRPMTHVDPLTGVRTTRFFGEGTFISRLKPDSMRVVRFLDGRDSARN